MSKFKFLIILVFFIVQNTFAQAPQNTLTCPSNNSADSLEDWRDLAITHISRGKFGEVREGLRSCFSSTPACLKDLAVYNDLNGMYPRYAEGDPVEGFTLSSEKDLPPEFAVKNAQGNIVPNEFKIPDNILEVAKRKNWKVLPYKTRGTGGFNAPPNLLLVAIPGATKDIYVQVSLRPDVNSSSTEDNPNPVPQGGNFSHGLDTATVISVDKTKNPPVGQLRLMRSSNDGKSYRWENHLEASACIQCHTVPLRSISPRGYLTTNGTEQRLSPAMEKIAVEINEMMLVEKLSWGKVKVNNHEVTRGPKEDSQPYGWAPRGSPTREEAFIKECSSNLRPVENQARGNYRFTAQPSGDPSKVNWRKVSEAMKCTRCHDNTIRGYLHGNLSFSEIEFKLLVDRSMPPQAELNMDERLALANCLKAEYQAVNEEWKKSGEWLKKMDCQAVTTPSNSGQPSNPATPASR